MAGFLPPPILANTLSDKEITRLVPGAYLSSTNDHIATLLEVFNDLAWVPGGIVVARRFAESIQQQLVA